MSSNTSSSSNPPPLPRGKSKHHIVVLESMHCQMPTFDFPHTITLHPRTTSAEVADRIKDASIVIACVTPVTPSDMSQAPDLGCLAIMAVGISWLDKADCASRGVTVTNCPAGNVDAVGEHFLALYFAVRKRIVDNHDVLTRSNEWVEKGTLTRQWRLGPPMGCSQETLGIIGYGTLGKRIERLARALGFARILVSERKHAGSVREGRMSFQDVLREATTVVVCVPREPDTMSLIDESEFALMRADAVVVNVARGGIVNEAALADALRQHRIAGAATDVLETEPGGPGTSPLIPDPLKPGEAAVPNLVISPHIAWYSQSTIVNYQRMLKEGVEGWADGKLFLEESAAVRERVKDVVVVHAGKVWR